MIFATAQMFLSLAASMSYALKRDWMHALYWLAAAVITFAVLRMK